MARGECLPVAGTLPLLPLAAALGELAGLDGGRLMAAVLEAAPGFVRAEVERLVPQLAPGGGPGADERGESWQRERLFAGVAQLLDAVAVRSAGGVGLVVEDVHWADSETLDCLTFLSRALRPGAAHAVVTCRSDEAPLAPQVAGWLAQVRGVAATEEITLGPLSRPQVERQAAALAGRPVSAALVDELFKRAEGNPFFTEQLMAVALATGAAEGGPPVPTALSARLAGLLAARAGRCAGEARAVLDALAVAGRPLGEDLLGAVTGLDAGAVRRGLRELAVARLLADGTTPQGGHRPRHALLAEVVAAGLLPGERVLLHERTAGALEAADGKALAGEAAGHWQAAGRPAEELLARVAAAGAAERVFGYAQAATHWQRAIELWPEVPDAPGITGLDLPRLYIHAIDALDISGDSEGAGVWAEEAYRRFADHPDYASAAVIHHCVALFRGTHNPAASLPLMTEALRLFESSPPSAEHAEALLDYAMMFLLFGEGRQEASLAALNHAFQIAEAAHATDLFPSLLAARAVHEFLRGQIQEGFATLERGRALAEESGYRRAVLDVGVFESDALLLTGKYQAAVKVAVGGLDAARQSGHDGSFHAAMLAANAADGLLALGRTAEAAELIDPLTSGPPVRDHWFVYHCRAVIDLLRGDLVAAARRGEQIRAFHMTIVDWTRVDREQAAELALWTGRPDGALGEVLHMLETYHVPDLTIFSGKLLTTGMRACADLAEQARARRDEPAAEEAMAAAHGLVLWAEQMGGAPFTDHAYVAAIPAERATWEAERTRLAGASDPAAWGGAAKTWNGLGCPHRAGYAWWRQAQAQLDAGQPPTAAAAALRSAVAAADGHQPLLAEIRKLAERARIPLSAPPGIPAKGAGLATPPRPYGLTGRELAVLRLVAAGRSNAQIGAELFISRATASVHVTSILRKLGVTNRVQAAALAERAGLLDTPQS
jgi:DNA-binding CsgD family transcriptional regulator/tetratricopeptide (TPR) repeat protein